MKIKQIVISVFLFCFAVMAFAQKQITVEDIWKKYLFYPKSVPGFASMPNSDYYSVISKTAITKHSFETGDAVGDILTEEALQKASGGKLSLGEEGSSTKSPKVNAIPSPGVVICA